MKMRPQPPGLAKLPTGIPGFDEITGGGLPRARTTLVMGGPGCGKTVFALQCLVNGARQTHEAGILVAFEEGAAYLVTNAATFGWDLPRLTRKHLFFLDARLSPDVVKAGEFDLLGLLSVLEAQAKAMRATRIVFDGIDVLLALLDDPVAERRELYRLRDWLAKTGLTALITHKGGGRATDDRYSFLQFMVDCVVVLGHQVVDGAAFRHLRVVKYRGSGFLGDEFPLSITTPDGLQVITRGPAELTYGVSDERVSSGIPRLDDTLRGGYHRGSNILISGAPGTAKSTLAGLFVAAACRRGERALYVSFDEGGAQIVRNLRSVGVQLAPHLRSGVLKMYCTRTRGPNLDDQFGTLRAMVHAHRARCLVIDPLSALSTRLPGLISADPSQQFLDYLRRERITVLNTSLMEGLGTSEATATGMSTIADTWIHLSYHVQDGERTRALTIVKSRGTGHSNQVRELKLADAGVTLTDVFVAGGKVLMGVARWEWEQEQRATRTRHRTAAELKRLQLQLAQAAAGARLQVIQTEMDARRAEIALLADATGSASKIRKTDRAALRKMRHADADHVAAPRAGRTPDAATNGARRAR